jgi:hypothetical protein
MPAKPNRASGKPAPQHGDQTAVQAQALEAKRLAEAAAAPQVDEKPVPPVEALVADSIDLHFVARKPRGKSLVITIKPGD